MPSGGLSELVARILGQLAISSWLPGGFLVVALVALGTFRAQESLDLAEALEALKGTDTQLMFLFWALPVLVVVTMLTQAFSFEAIRILEGYWSHRGPVGAVRGWKTQRQLRRKRRMHEERIRESSRIFVESRHMWLERGASGPLVDALERLAGGLSIADLPEDLQRSALRRKWWTYCDPADVARVQDLEIAERGFPLRDARTMPTNLGNILRAAEDGLRNTGGDLEGFVLRNRGNASARVQQQHDQFRTRLDMYSTLVFVSLLLGAAYPAALWGVVPVAERPGVILAGVAFLGLAVVCYRATIAAAKGYTVTLRQIDQMSGAPPA